MRLSQFPVEQGRSLFVRSGMAAVRFKDSSAVAYYTADGQEVVGFSGKRRRPDFHYRFKTLARRDQVVSEWAANVQEREAERAKARKVERHQFQPGDIFSVSWGYDQTNVDFYKLGKLVGETMAEVIPIGSIMTDRSEPPCDYVVANPDVIREWDVLLDWKEGQPYKRKRLTPDGFTVGGNHTASPWDGKPEYETSAGWGH